MKTYFAGMTLPAALAATVLLGLPLVAQAQKDPIQPGNSASSTGVQKISIDVEDANLYSALTLLFGQIHANFTLDPSLKQAAVTAHLHNIPFGAALDNILKAAGLPLSYQQENNIWTIVPAVPEPLPVSDGSLPIVDTVPPVAKLKFKRLTGLTTNAEMLVSYFHSKGEILKSSVMRQFGNGGLGGGQSGFGGGFGQQGGGYGQGNSFGQQGNGYGQGFGQGNGQSNGQSNAYGQGNGFGYGNDSSQGNSYGNGNGFSNPNGNGRGRNY